MHIQGWFPLGWTGMDNKAEVDVFLELSCFLYDSTDVGNLLSGSPTLTQPFWTKFQLASSFKMHWATDIDLV